MKKDMYMSTKGAKHVGRKTDRNAKFLNNKGGIFCISSKALCKMRSYVQNSSQKKEAGGVLLGRYIIDSNDVIVDIITVPMKGDQRSKKRFFRSARSHQAVIDAVWKASRHRFNYLGGWHTHPEHVPNMSKIDQKDWKKALKKEEFDNDVLYFVIVGTREICVWEGSKGNGMITQLARIIG